MFELEEVRAFVERFYATKDSMHGLKHVDRLYFGALNLGSQRLFDPNVLMLGAYFHGIFRDHKPWLSDFINHKNLSHGLVSQVETAVLESMVNSKPKTIEGILLHDAHILEGGKAFMVAKSLITGSERGQTLSETLEYMRNNILGHRTCILPEAQAIYEEMEQYAIGFVADLEAGLAFGVTKS